MKTTFLGQGLEFNSINAVGYHLIACLEATDFHTFTGLSAFASEAGIFGLSSYIQAAKTNYETLTLIVGIDQDGTSEEALNEILSLDIESYIFYQSEAPIFHPKIYLFEGNSFTKLIIGSTNLTARGLFTNVECSLLIEFGNNDQEGVALLAELKSYYRSIFDFSDPNLFKINNSIITDFIAKGIVPNEDRRRQIYSKKNTASQSTNVSSATSNFSIPRRRPSTIPSFFPTKSRNSGIRTDTAQQITPGSSATVQNVQSVAIPFSAQTANLIWQKVSLSQSDAQHVPQGTAVTANLKLSQARFRINNVPIDQTTYFRNHIFNNLAWAKTKAGSNTYEGNVVGNQTLKLSHDPVRIAGQGNTPTWLHWGNTLLQLLRQTNVTGKTLNLYQSNQNFSIEIV